MRVRTGRNRLAVAKNGEGELSCVEQSDGHKEERPSEAHDMWFVLLIYWVARHTISREATVMHSRIRGSAILRLGLIRKAMKQSSEIEGCNKDHSK